MTRKHTLLSAAALAATSGLALADLASFNDLTLGTEYTVGQTFTSDGIDFEILDFRPGVMFSNRARVDNNLMAGGDGFDLELNNVRLELVIPFPEVPSVTIFFGQFGGENNLFVNGEMLTSGNIFDLDGMTIGGADIDVLSYDASHGRLTVTGDIESFGISGQELWVDNLRFAIPAPSGLALMGFAAVGATRRRR
ncbi:MAG: PEP-CTERM sorting domain-containing protein [Phycisphaerales bacterium JB059]